MLHLVRSFTPSEMSFDDHVLSGRLVPYGEVADVADMLPDGTIDRYREGFELGAFARQATSRERGVLNRVSMRHLHDRGDGLGFLGHLTALREEADGLYGSVPVIASRAQDVDGLIRNGVDGLSIEFHSPKGGTNERDGVRWRSRAVLWAISLEPVGAYAGARVLSYREPMPGDEDDDEGDDATTPPVPPTTPVEGTGDDDGTTKADDDETPEQAAQRAAMDADYWQRAAARQIELDAKHRPKVLTEEEARLEALHATTVAAYRSR